MLAAPFLFKKGLKRKQVVCFMLVFAGILMVSAPGILGQTQIDSFGLLCGFGSAIAHAFMVIFTMKAPSITGIKNAAIQLIVSFFTVAVFVVTMQGLTMPASPNQWFYILFLGFVNTGIGCYLYFSDIAKLSVASVSILGYLEPLSAVIFSFLLLHETFTLPELAGTILILIGALASEIHRESKSFTSSSET